MLEEKQEKSHTMKKKRDQVSETAELRQQAEQELRESERRFREMMENIDLRMKSSPLRASAV